MCIPKHTYAGHGDVNTCTSLRMHPFLETQQETLIKTTSNQPSMCPYYQSNKPKLHRRLIKQ